MNKFTNCAETLKLQNAAYEARRLESIATDDFLGGALTEEMYMEAMDRTAEAVAIAIAGGVSHKDLPAV